MNWFDNRSPYLPNIQEGLNIEILNSCNEIEEIKYKLQEDELSDTESEDEEKWKGMKIPDFNINIFEIEDETDVWVISEAVKGVNKQKDKKKEVKQKVRHI